MSGGLSDVYGMGIVVQGENRLTNSSRGIERDFDRIEKSAIHADGKIKGAIKSMNLEFAALAGGAIEGVKVALNDMANQAKGAETINSLKRDLLTVGFAAQDVEKIFQATLDITKKPYILAGWKDLLQASFDIKGAMGSIGTPQGVTTALEALALLQSGTPEKNVVEELKNSWIGFFQGYGKYSQNIQADSQRFVNMMTKVNNEFATTNAKIARGFGPNAILMANYNQTLESALAVTGALSETMGDKAPAAIEALFRELSQSSIRLRAKGIVITDEAGRSLQAPDVIKQFQRAIPGLGVEAFNLEKIGAFAHGFQISSEAMMAIQNLAAMMPKMQSVLGEASGGTEAIDAAKKRALNTYEKSMIDAANATDTLTYSIGQGQIKAFQVWEGEITKVKLGLADLALKYPGLATAGQLGGNAAWGALKWGGGFMALRYLLNSSLGGMVGGAAGGAGTALASAATTAATSGAVQAAAQVAARAVTQTPIQASINAMFMTAGKSAATSAAAFQAAQMSAFMSNLGLMIAPIALGFAAVGVEHLMTKMGLTKQGYGPTQGLSVIDMIHAQLSGDKSLFSRNLARQNELAERRNYERWAKQHGSEFGIRLPENWAEKSMKDWTYNEAPRTINVYGAPGQDTDALADEIMKRMEADKSRKTLEFFGAPKSSLGVRP